MSILPSFSIPAKIMAEAIQDNSLWSRQSIMEFLQEFALKQHWEQVEKSIRHIDENDPFWHGENACQILKKIMKKCNGVLDVYGPVEDLAEKFKIFHMNISTQKKYQDSRLLYHYAKKDILKGSINDAMRSNVLKLVDKQMFNLMIESVSAKIERQLAGSYDILAVDWYETVSFNLGTSHRKMIYDIESLKMRCQKSAISWVKDAPFVFSEFSKLFYKEHDKKLLTELQGLLLPYFQNGKPDSAKCLHLYTAYSHIREIKEWLLATIEKSSYGLLPFSESKKILGNKFPVEPPVIRLITFGDDKILFAKDVKNAIERVMQRQNKKNETIPNDLLKVESEEEKQNGVYYVMFRSEYLKILKSLQISPDNIILVDEEMFRNPHFTCPIFSPYGTKCKPAIDVLNELLSILTIEMRVWDRIQSGKLKELEKKLKKVCAMFMDPTKPRHFIECGRIEKLGDKLRELVEPLMKKPLSSLQGSKIFNFSSKMMTMDLFRTGADDLHLSRFYPEIMRSFPIVFAQHTNFYIKNINPLELTGILQHCLLLCLTEKIPSISPFICSQKECRQFGIWKCSCPEDKTLPFEDRSLYTPAVKTDEYDYKMKYDYMANQNTCFGSLIRKTGKQQLVCGYMAHAFVLNSVINQIHPKYRHRIVDLVKSQNNWFYTEAALYITSDEMMHLAEDAVRKFNAQYKSERFETVEKKTIFFGEAYRENAIVQWIQAVFNQCVQFSASAINALSSFDKYMPNRTVYMNLFRCYSNVKDGSLLCVDSGEFLKLIKMKMLQHEVAETRDSWHDFIHVVLDCQKDDGYRLLPVDTAIRLLNDFPINPGLFTFVPVPNSVFRSALCQISYVLTHDAPEIREEEIDTKEVTTEDIATKELATLDVSVKKSSKKCAKKNPEPVEQHSEEPECGHNKVFKLARDFSEIYREISDKNQELRVVKAEQSNMQKAQKKAEKSHNDKIVRLNERIENMQKENTRKLEEQEKKSKSLTAKLNSKETALKTLEKELSSEKTNSMQEIQKKNDELKELKRDLKSAESRITEKERTIDEQNKCSNLKEMEISKLRKEVAELRAKLLIEKQNGVEKMEEFKKKLAETTANNQGESEERRGQLGFENRLLQTKLRMEQINHESARRQNESQRAHIEYLESLLAGRQQSSVFPSTTDTPPTTPAFDVFNQLPQQATSSQILMSPPNSLVEYVPITQQLNQLNISTVHPSSSGVPIGRDSAPECIICLGVVGERGRTAQCKECKTRFHSSCIEEWLQKKATCPVCSRSFPSPRNFPPLK